MFEDKLLNIIKPYAGKSKVVLQGPTGCGKTSVMTEGYKYKVNELGVSSDKILVLVPNGHQSNIWRRKSEFKASGRLWITTYYSFIKDEISIYYPKVLENCPQIQKKSIKPVFLPYDASKYLVAKVVNWNREKRGAFSSITSSSDRVASDLINNLLMAAASSISAGEISSRLYNALPVKDNEKLEIFEESRKILDSYKAKCLSLGVFDYGMSVYIYNTCLLSDEEYRNSLIGRVKHLIIDGIEECSPVEIDFVQDIIPCLKSCLLGYNNERGFGNGYRGIDEYIKNRLYPQCTIIDMDKSFTCSSFMNEFSEMLFYDIKNNKASKRKNPMVEKAKVFELRSEMIENIGERIMRLVKEEGYNPWDIAVLSTFADPVTEWIINNITQKGNIGVKNISRKKRIIDNEINFCILTLAQLCYPSYSLPPACESIGRLIRKVLKIDPVRAAMLAKEVHNKGYFPCIEELRMSEWWSKLENIIGADKYNYLKNWIELNKEKSSFQRMDSFFYKAFLEVFMSDDSKKEDVQEVGGLIKSAEVFLDALDKFPNMNPGKGLLELILTGMSSSGAQDETESEEDNELVMLATPQNYISGCYSNKVIILSGISSRNWVCRNVKELTNTFVLHKTWDVDEIYTEEMEEENQRICTASVIKSIIKRCSEKLIIFQSQLSANGYENDGILADYL